MAAAAAVEPPRPGKPGLEFSSSRLRLSNSLDNVDASGLAFVRAACPTERERKKKGTGKKEDSKEKMKGYISSCACGRDGRNSPGRSEATCIDLLRLACRQRSTLAPAVTAIEPNTVRPEGGVYVVLRGENFGPSIESLSTLYKRIK
jgi:hypothetical protein